MSAAQLTVVLERGVRVAAEFGSPYCAPEHALAGLARASGPALAGVLGVVSSADLAQAALAAAGKLDAASQRQNGDHDSEIPVSVSLYQAAGRAEGLRAVVEGRSDDLAAVIDLAALLLDDLARSRVGAQLRAGDLDVVLRSALDAIRTAV